VAVDLYQSAEDPFGDPHKEHDKGGRRFEWPQTIAIVRQYYGGRYRDDGGYGTRQVQARRRHGGCEEAIGITELNQRDDYLQ